jgi:hypothetical protein
MKHTFRIGLLSIALTVGSAAVARADFIVYDLNNYTSLQNGWTLTGSIKTDGTIGEIGAPDILSWQYTISNGLTSFTASSDSGGYAQVTHVTATPTQLLLSAPNGFTYNQLWLIGSLSDPTASFLLYDRDNTGANPEQDFYRQWIRPSYSWSDYSQDSTGLPLGGDPWVIATAETAVVPAPSSIVLVLTAFGSLASYGLVCRRGRRADLDRRRATLARDRHEQAERRKRAEPDSG